MISAFYRHVQVDSRARLIIAINIGKRGHIAEGAILGCGAIVLWDVPSYTVVEGMLASALRKVQAIRRHYLGKEVEHPHHSSAGY